MTKVLVEAYELVDDGFIDANDFRDFSYAKVVRIHTGMNPELFKGTVVEDAVESLKGEVLLVDAE